MRRRPKDQYTLFDQPLSLPNGFVYRPDFISLAEEEQLVAWFDSLPLTNAPYFEYTAQRRILSFGWSMEYGRLVPGEPLPQMLAPLARRIAKWLVIPERSIVEALVTEYTPGAAVGWHKDNEPCEIIVGISFAGWAEMELRPIAHQEEVTRIPLEPRSVYVMQKESRHEWHHRIRPVEALRYSITFRTLRG